MSHTTGRPILDPVLRLLFGSAYLLAAGVCLLSARHVFLEFTRPHDLFPLSVLVSLILAMLFAVAFLSCLLATAQQGLIPKGRAWLGSLTLAILLVSLSTLVIAQETATSFVSWEQWRGAPLAWLENGHFYGPCMSLGRPCSTYWFLNLRAWALLLNLALTMAAVVHARRMINRRS
jgi:hypothetical protein